MRFWTREIAIVFGLLTLLWGPNAAAQQTPAQRQAGLNIHGELMQCAPFFELLAVCMRTRPDVPASEATARSYQSRAADFQDLGARIGLGLGLTPDAIASRYRMNMETMIRLTEQQPCENLASLMSRFQSMCSEYSSNPERAMSRHLR
ncbi:hypothetical protein [Roseomonas rosulenta]|uniref:hypothetical protein n=1 Tax=Roseomonas rosulenta TaxID=2748667 RepID=UPI0018DF772C|nr:hypothetical protein [Roseomonas rosulenta]